MIRKIVSNIRNYHYDKQQTNSWHREEEPHSNQETPGRQTKQRKQLSLPHQGGCKTSIGHIVTNNKKYNRTITESHNGSIKQQRIKNSRTAAIERTAAYANGVGGGGGWGRGLNAFYWYQIFALDSSVVKSQNLLSSRGGFLTIAMYHHRETI